MTRLNIDLQKTQTFEIMGREYALKLNRKSFLVRAKQLELSARELTSQAASQEHEAPERISAAYDEYVRTGKELVSDMFGEGALEMMVAEKNASESAVNDFVFALIEEVSSAIRDEQLKKVSQRYA